MATHSSILAWRVPWKEEPGGPQSMGSQRVRHNQETNTLVNYVVHPESNLWLCFSLKINKMEFYIIKFFNEFI